MSGGYRKYLQNILPLMAKDKRVDGLEVYIPIGNAAIITNNTFTLHNIPAGSVSKNKAWLRNELAKHQFDVIYIPSAMWINCGNTPIVTMIQNMEPLVVPFQGNPLKECIKNIGRYTANLYACRRSIRIIAISKFVKTYLTEKWGIKSDRIGLVYHGIDLCDQSSVDDHGAIAFMKSFPFLFTAGSIRPARGLEDIIRALAILNTERPVQLAIGGNVDSGMEPYFVKLKVLAEKLGVLERIKWAGKLNDSGMSWYFKNCTAFIMTSRVESFGMIAGEAMAHGCVCIDFSTLAKQIQVVISMGQAERTAMSSAAKDIASRFSWGICAQKTVDELQKALQ
jgi:glycosyltransferase involved in cell wall biosynthesis